MTRPTPTEQLRRLAFALIYCYFDGRAERFNRANIETAFKHIALRAGLSDDLGTYQRAWRLALAWAPSAQ